MRTRLSDLALLALLSAATLLVHGYHPYVEDAEIYLPGVKKILNPALYPQNAAFFASHAHLTMFPNIIAASVRITHLPFDWAILAWQLLSTFIFLYACWRLARLIFPDPLAAWGGAALVASLLTIPVAGTALYIMDQYLTARSLSTATVMMLVASTAERKYIRAAIWALITLLVHPLMVVFGVSYALLLIWFRLRTPDSSPSSAAIMAALFPFGLFPPPTDVYRTILKNHRYFLLMEWTWYEWVGIFAPLLIFWWFARIARKQNLPLLQAMCRALIVFGALFFAAGVVITIPPAMVRFAELQPMRALHLEFVLLFLLSGGLLAQFVLKKHIWRWLLLFVPLCSGMFYASRQLFPDTPQLEFPNAAPRNPWVEAFLWIRDNTPTDAFFALDPDHMALPGEDQHGFRALAERSMLADRVKDSGAITMFPKLTETWLEQTTALEGWKKFQRDDFTRLKTTYGVTWIVLEKPGVPGFVCPYENRRLLVCKID